MKFIFVSLVFFVTAFNASSQELQKLEKKFKKTCSNLSKINDRNLDEAKQICREHYTNGAVSILFEFDRLLDSETKLSPETRSFIIDNLDSIRKAVIQSNEWNRPTARWNIKSNLAELSGFALDKTRDVLWGISDETPDLVRISLKTGHVENVRLDRIESRDTEAVLVAPNGDVWVLDVGDNDSVRKAVLIYVFNPDLVENGVVPVERTIKIQYPQNKKPNVESAFLLNGSLYLVEKSLYQRAEIFSAEINYDFDTLMVKSEGFLPPMAPISDITFDVNENRILALTWFGISEIFLDSNVGPRAISLQKNFWGQQEAVAFDGESKTLYVGTEEGFIFALGR